MFGSDATRLARIDWSKYGATERTATPTLESLQRQVDGYRAGLQQLAEELANMAGNPDIPLNHRAPFISLNYTPDAPGVSPDAESLESFYPGIGGVAGDSYYDPATSLVNGAQAGFFQGVLIFQPAMNNPNVLQNQGRHRIVQVGGRGAGIKFENIYVENLLDYDGNPYTSSALPIGSVMLWAGAIGSIPTGWALMDGTANSAGSGIDMRGQVPYGYSGAGDFATIGGSISAALTWSGSPLAGSSTSSVTISAHSGSSSVNIGPEELVISPSAIAEDFAAGGDIHAYVFSSEPAISPNEHTHELLGTQVAALLGNHTGTVDNSTVAGNFTVNTPSAVRSAGKVLAFIERIS